MSIEGKQVCPRCQGAGRVLVPYLGWRDCQCPPIDPAAAAMEPPGAEDSRALAAEAPHSASEAPHSPVCGFSDGDVPTGPEGAEGGKNAP